MPVDQAPLAPEAEVTKHCVGCDEHVPLYAFPLNQHGKPRTYCRCCHSADVARRRAAKRAALRETPAWKQAHAERIERNREARRIATEYRRAQRALRETPAEVRLCRSCEAPLPAPQFGRKADTRCQSCRAAIERERYHRKRGRIACPAPEGDPDRQPTIEERTSWLASLLAGTAVNGECISSQEAWEAAASELDRLWLKSGDKDCGACGRTVPPAHMLPPGPANFYPGTCRVCSVAAYVRRSSELYGRPPEPRPIPMRDGSSITIGELALRHRERQAQPR